MKILETLIDPHTTDLKTMMPMLLTLTVYFQVSKKDHNLLEGSLQQPHVRVPGSGGVG
jgi:hypothetical protein